MSGLQNTGNGVSKVARKTGKVGGQKNNKNAMKHGCYQQIDRIDKRTTDGKLIASIEAALCDALGNPSPMEILAIQREAIIAWRCNKFEKRILAGNGDVPESLERAYMQTSRALMDILRTVGMKRRARPVQGLQEHLRATYGVDSE